MFLSFNDNWAPWAKQYLRAHALARDYVCNPATFDDLIRANDNRKPIRVWIPDKVYQCATTLQNFACSHIFSNPI